MSSIEQLREQIRRDREEIRELQIVLGELVQKKEKLEKYKLTLDAHITDVKDYDLLKNDTWEGVLAFEATLLKKACGEKLDYDLNTVIALISEVNTAIENIRNRIEQLHQDIAACEAEIARLEEEEQE